MHQVKGDGALVRVATIAQIAQEPPEEERNGRLAMNLRKLIHNQGPALVMLWILAIVTPGHASELRSPDGRVKLDFQLKDTGDVHGVPMYSVTCDGRAVLNESRLGVQTRGDSLTHNFQLSSESTSSSNTTWMPVLGERNAIVDDYNQLVVDLQLAGVPGHSDRLRITFRAYNEGIAFSYSFPREGNGLYIDIVDEETQFAFPSDAIAWAVYTAQGDYLKTVGPISQIGLGAERPLTVRLASDLYASITEAKIEEYARMKLRRAEGTNNVLQVLLDGERDRDGGVIGGEVLGKAPFATPWRVVMIANSPASLLEEDYLILNLNDPSALKDTSWIKPGKVIREVTLTTEGAKACIDFAVKHNLQYIEFDSGWYGPEFNPLSDARDVTPTRKGTLDLHQVINYGNSRGIGVILYVGHIAMEQQLDQILPLYESWGVKGIKFGFVSVGSQFWTAFVHEAIRKAAVHHLMVDVHDEFRNFGYERTYPNLMTVEGIRGNEEFPSPALNATLPFTRFLAGPADYTFCWNIPRLKNSKAHQLALSTIYYSPWQFLYWYDRPSQLPDEPAMDYWDHLPTTWDETRVLDGIIGQRVAVARRKGDEWFLGAIAPVGGDFPIRLNFLPSERRFTARIYADLPSSPGVGIETRTVDNRSVIQAAIPQNGGMAIRFTPVY